MVSEGATRKELNLCFEKMKMEGVVISEWKDIPVELLMRILTLVDDRSVIIASGICSGWRDAISLGLTRLSLSWYVSSFFFFFFSSFDSVSLFVWLCLYVIVYSVWIRRYLYVRKCFGVWIKVEPFWLSSSLEDEYSYFDGWWIDKIMTRGDWKSQTFFLFDQIGQFLYDGFSLMIDSYLYLYVPRN